MGEEEEEGEGEKERKRENVLLHIKINSKQFFNNFSRWYDRSNLVDFYFKYLDRLVFYHYFRVYYFICI